MTFHVNFRKQISRRAVLRGLGVSMALPSLAAMEPAFAGSVEASKVPRRFVGLTVGLGLLPENLYPSQSGKDFAHSRYSAHLDDLRDQITLVSGSSHPGVSGGHRASASIFTANTMAPAGKGANTISLDQYMAKYLRNQTRLPSLVLSLQGNESSSYTENGAMIPAVDSPSAVFSQLFVEESATQKQLQVERLAQGRSIMDVVADDAKSLMKTLGPGDRDRMDSYFTSVRELETRLAQAQDGSEKPKPVVEMKKPVDIGNAADVMGRLKLMCDVVKLALQTDSTRFVTINIPGAEHKIPIQGVMEGYHTLSHHGKDEEKLEQLSLVEDALIMTWGNFIRELQGTAEDEGTVLDRSMILATSNLGNSSNHDTRNMPVLFAGGGFRHGQHLAFDQKNNVPLCNLYVSMLQRAGLEVDGFASSTGTLSGLEMG